MPRLTIASLVGLAALIGLGIWQLDRMGQKSDAIARYETQRAIEARPLQTVLCDIRVGAMGQRIIAPTVDGPALRYFGRSTTGEAGWRVFRALPKPACLQHVEGDTLLIESGFVTLSGLTLDAPAHVTLDALPNRSVFEAPNTVEAGEFHHVDLDAMAQALGIESLVPDYWLVGSGDSLPQYLVETPPSRHFGYALTWFGLALALAGIFIAYHVSKNRLGFTRR